MANRSWVDERAIQSQFVHGGDVYKKAVDVSNDVRKAARRRIHNRSRNLWTSVTATRHTLPLGVSFKVAAWAHYALWVEEGTKADGAGWIFPHKRRGLLILYQDGRAAPARYARSELAPVRRVHGQKGRHYLRNGLAAALAANGLTR